MSVTAPADRRFRRSRIPAARRRHLRARPVWRVAKALALAGLVAGAGFWAAASVVGLPWLRVQHIRVLGNQRVHAGEVAALLEGMTGQSLLVVDLDRWRSRLFASAWVADATLRRRLPGTIQVELRERAPMGIARAGSDLFLVDAAGTVIDEYGPRYADCDLPIIDGMIVTPVSVPPAIDRARGQLVSRLMSELRTRPDLARLVSQIDAGNPHDVRVILDGDPAVVRLGETAFAERLDSYVRLQAALREQVPDIDYVDVRFGERVYVGVRAGAGGARRRTAGAQPARNAGARLTR
ncbi:MAG: FtsQ-type POTRA domain-containing protein [Vicinamibacterales bacterium]